MSELKPCPFCGEEAEFERRGDAHRSTIVTCTSCGASLESGAEWDHERDWNSRPEEDRLKAENQRLRAALAVAKEDVQSWGAYADTYFQEKWDLAGDIAAIDAVLRVSDGSREAGETAGLDPKDDSAVTAGQTPPSLSPKEQKGE